MMTSYDAVKYFSDLHVRTGDSIYITMATYLLNPERVDNSVLRCWMVLFGYSFEKHKEVLKFLHSYYITEKINGTWDNDSSVEDVLLIVDRKYKELMNENG